MLRMTESGGGRADGRQGAQQAAADHPAVGAVAEGLVISPEKSSVQYCVTPAVC